MNILEAIEYYMEEYGMSEADACRCVDLDFFPDEYDPEDYE